MRRVVMIHIPSNSQAIPKSNTHYTPPFVQNADGIWGQTPLDSCLINLHLAWMAGLSDLGPERSNPATQHLPHRFPVYVYMT